jgi:hypothetical protein
MDLTALNRICWTISIICIVAGTALSFSMIWGEQESEFLWKAWISIGVLFFASAATLIVSKVVSSKGGESGQRL